MEWAHDQRGPLDPDPPQIWRLDLFAIVAGSSIHATLQSVLGGAIGEGSDWRSRRMPRSHRS